MLILSTFIFTVLFLLLVAKSILVVITLFPIVGQMTASGLFGFWLVSTVMILLTFFEFYSVKKQNQSLKIRNYFEGGLSATYLIGLIVLGRWVSTELSNDINFEWNDGKVYSLEAFGELNDKYLHETENGYEVIIKKSNSHSDIREFNFEDITIYEREGAVPSVKIIEGKSATTLEKWLDRTGLGNKLGNHLLLRVKVEIYLPLSTNSYFAINNLTNLIDLIELEKM